MFRMLKRTDDGEPAKKQLSPAEKKYYEDRSKWVEAMFADDFGHAEFRVLYFIAQRAGHEKEGSYWYVARIAEECRCSTKTVSDATMKAERLGYVKIYRVVGQKNFYKPLFFWLGDT
jgi:DNA-binding MarR family transcriptional regulator